MESRQLICNVSWGSAPTRLPGLGHIAFAAQWFGRTVTDAAVKTDGHAAYNARTLAARNHDAKVQSAADKKTDDHVQLCHWAAAGLKRWLLGTHHGSVSDKHLQSYLDEHAFRHNRRKTKGVGRLVARCLENMLSRQPLTMRQLIQDTHQCRTFEGVPY